MKQKQHDSTLDRRKEIERSQMEFERRFKKIGNKGEKKFALAILRGRF